MKNLEFEIKNMTINPKSGNAKLISGAINYFGFNIKQEKELK